MIMWRIHQTLWGIAGLYMVYFTGKFFNIREHFFNFHKS